eukprot:4857604-Prorocentrum_lima.AAC.1
MDARGKWLGLKKKMRQAYSPSPYSRRTPTGAHVGPHSVAEKAAEYLVTSNGGLLSQLPCITCRSPPKRTLRRQTDTVFDPLPWMNSIEF